MNSELNGHELEQSAKAKPQGGDTSCIAGAALSEAGLAAELAKSCQNQLAWNDKNSKRMFEKLA